MDPAPTRSTRTTSAPKSARIMPQNGAGARPAISTTRIPCRALMRCLSFEWGRTLLRSAPGKLKTTYAAVLRTARAIERPHEADPPTPASIDGRKLVFEVSAHDGVDTVCEGRHERVVIDIARFN